MSWPWLTDFSFIATYAVGATALYFHLLAIEPARPRLLRWVVATGAVVGIALTLWFNVQRTSRVGEELYMSHLFPPKLRLAQPLAIDRFIQRTGTAAGAARQQGEGGAERRGTRQRTMTMTSEPAARPRSVLVTGGSRGIGAATAWKGAQQGWAVAVNYTREPRRRRTDRRPHPRAGGQARAVQADVAEKRRCEDVRRRSTARCRRSARSSTTPA